MKADFTKDTHSGKIASNRKEDNFTSQLTLVTVSNGEVTELAQVRIYSTSARKYCCIWVNHAPIYVSGGGYAGGYGYHRPSAAMQNALDDAGIKLSHNIAGYGESLMIEALQAIGAALGFDNCKVLRAHG